MFIEYQPFKILYNQFHSICSMSYSTKEEAITYAKSRGLKDNEIGIKEHIVYEKYIIEF